MNYAVPSMSKRAEELMLEVQRLARLPDVARLESAPRLSVGLTAPLSTQVPAAQGAVPRLASPPLRGRPSSGGPMRTHERTSQLALDAVDQPSRHDIATAFRVFDRAQRVAERLG
jgi:hypothetical protein